MLVLSGELSEQFQSEEIINLHEPRSTWSRSELPLSLCHLLLVMLDSCIFTFDVLIQITELKQHVM